MGGTTTNNKKQKTDIIMLSNIKKAGRVGSLRASRGTARTGQLVKLFSQIQAPHITIVFRLDGKCSVRVHSLFC